jgi:F0F1-type ATP synthase epsilon subunit
MTIDLIFSRPYETKTITVDWLEVETEKGNLVIQPGHAPSSIVLKEPSFVQWSLPSGTIEKIHIKRAFLKVDRHSCLLIIDSE